MKRSKALINLIATIFASLLFLQGYSLDNPDGLIDLIVAPEEIFDGTVFLINDWDGGDKDNQNVAEEVNRGSKISEDVICLSYYPDKEPTKTSVNNLVKNAQVLADSSKKGKVGIAMGAHSKHVVAWLTNLPASSYNYNNIYLVSHSNWNELDGKAGYDANYQVGDPPLEDTHGEDLRRGLYPNLAQISDLGVTIYEVPRTDHGLGGWGGTVSKTGGGTASIKTLDISDLGMVHYFKTGILNASRTQRNEYVSETLQKAAFLDDVDNYLITRYWDNNTGVPGVIDDYIPEQNTIQPTGGIEYGDNFVVFEAEAASYSDNYWTLREPGDPEYQKTVTSGSGIDAINNTYLEYTGPWNGDGENSKIAYTFTCPKTGDYQLAARLHQALKEGEKGDGANDFYVKMTGNYTSASSFTMDELTSKKKFWGRGINQWGTCQYLIESHIPVYRLTEGEVYTFTLYGRSSNACIDYILFFNTELKLSVNGDLATNPELYRPGGPAALSDKVAKIVFESSKTGLERIGESKALEYKVFPSTAVDQSITWRSSDTNVVKVDSNGVITGVAEGKATITAQSNDGGAIATSDVNVGMYVVTFDDFESPGFDELQYVGDNGYTWQMRAKNTIRFGSSNAIQVNRGILGVKGVNIPGGIASFKIKIKHLYQTDNPHKTILYINGNEVGSITQTQTGAYDFIVENINIPGDFTLTLKNASGEGETKSYATMYDDLSWSPYILPPTKLTITPDTNTIRQGASLKLKANYEPSNASTEIIWSSTNENVLLVNQYGVISAVGNTGEKAGIIIKSKFNDVADTTEFSIIDWYDVLLEKLKVLSPFDSVFPDKQFMVTANVSPLNADNLSYTWSSSDTNIAKVNQDGFVTPKNKGDVYIIATSNDAAAVMDSVRIVVKSIVDSVLITNSKDALDINEYHQLSASVYKQSTGYSDIVWSSSNPVIASVDQSGKVFGISEGTVTIRAAAAADTTVFDEVSLVIIKINTKADVRLSKNIIISPNPASNRIKLHGLKSYVKQVEIYNTNGNLVKNIQSDNLSIDIDISDLSNGLYILILDKQTSETIKFIKE